MQKFFYPRTVAIVGLSPTYQNIARVILQNCIEWGYNGKIYGVHPAGGEIYGIPIYKSITDVPEPVDIASIFISARHVPSAMRQCAQAGVKRFAIPTGGFSELGAQGDQLVNELIQISNEYNIRFIGPNCLTLMNADNGLALPFFPIPKIKTGSVSLIVQSGGILLSLLSLMDSYSLGVQKCASIGNKVSVDEVDLINYFSEDEKTNVICVYLESINRGREFMQAVSVCKKPVFVCKASRTEATKMVAFSHTAAAINDDEVVTLACEQSGAVRVSRIEDLVIHAKIAQLPKPRGRRIVAISHSGGLSILAADEAVKHGIPFAPLSNECLDTVKKHVNAGVIHTTNPMDIGDVYNPEGVREVLEKAIKDPAVDAAVILIIRQGQVQGPPEWESLMSRLNNGNYIDMIDQLLKESGKPIITVIYTPAEEKFAYIKRFSLPILDDIPQAFEALRIHMKLNLEPRREFIAPPNGPKLTGKELQLTSSSDGILNLPSSLEFLHHEGLEICPYVIAHDRTALHAAARKLGFPVVLKLISEDISHKSDQGFVALPITSLKELDIAFKRMKTMYGKIMESKSSSKAPAYMLQKMVTKGAEIILGVKRDPLFGPVLMVGFGGVLANLINDVSKRIAPIDATQALTMIQELKSYPLLEGYRGIPKRDIPFLIYCLETISSISLRYPMIEEMDINPLFLYEREHKGTIVDARIRINSGSI